MALHGTIGVNGARIGDWVARRVSRAGGTDADPVYRYECIVHFDGRIVWEGEIEHRYADGAVVLAAKVLSQPRQPDPLDTAQQAAFNDPAWRTAVRGRDGRIRMNLGRGVLVANGDHTRDDVQGWFDRSQPGYYREQYRAALALFDREADKSVPPPVHPDEEGSVSCV